MQTEVMFAGFGGQGVMLIGQILAQAAMKEGKEVAWVPSYGPEMRGGTAYCTVVIGDKPIGSPIVKRPSHLVALNRPSLEKFAPAVKPGGVILVNSSLISVPAGRDDVDEFRLAANELAQELGNVRTANIITLAAIVERAGLVSFEHLSQTIKEKFASKSKLIPINMEAMEKGREIAKVKN